MIGRSLESSVLRRSDADGLEANDPAGFGDWICRSAEAFGSRLSGVARR